MIALPPQLAIPAAVEFVGRERELQAMNEVWERAKAGRPQLLFVAGEPGIGKTRLSLEFARAAVSKAPRFSSDAATKRRSSRTSPLSSR